MKYWIFKCDPEKYNLTSRLKDPVPTLTWRATRYRDEIKAGDIAFIWETGEQRGIRGVLRVDSDPDDIVEMLSEHQYSAKPDTGTSCRVTATLTDRTASLSAHKLRTVQGLEHMSVFEGVQQGTNFRVSECEARILAKLLQAQHAGKKQPRCSITSAQYVPAYKFGHAVHGGTLDSSDAIALLRLHGMNEASASFSVGNLRQMINGSSYGRAMSVEQTRHFIMALYRDNGIKGLQNAVAALALHLPHLRKSNHNDCPGLSELLRQSQDLLTLPPSEENAIDDLITPPEGIVTPKRTERKTKIFLRDPRVRIAVVQRSKGKCEYCGEPGFVMPNGKHYIETHHIISLGQDGPDTIDNVIGLCPEHHRQAHYGCDSKNLETEFSRILLRIV